MWKNRNITYIHHDYYIDKTTVIYKENGIEHEIELTSEDFKPFAWFNTKNEKRYNSLTHKNTFREIKNVTKETSFKYILLKPDTQFLIQNKAVYFKETSLKDLKSFTFDIETTGLNPETKEILAIGILCNHELKTGGKTIYLNTKLTSEKDVLLKFKEYILDEDPDLLIGHNVFSFDIPFILKRMEKYGIKPVLGKFGSEITREFNLSKVSRLKKGFEFYQYRIPGRYIIDTMHLAIIEDARRNEFDSYSLKYLAKYLNIAPKDRVYIDGDEIYKMYETNFEQFCKYLEHDLEETAALSKLMLPAYFQMTKIIPINLQTNIYAGATQKFRALFSGDYYHNRKPIPEPQPKEKFEGATTDTLNIGIFDNIHKFDVASLYPSSMEVWDLFPKSDILGSMKKFLNLFKTERLIYKKKANDEEDLISQGLGDVNKYEEFHAYQLALKILINSFYGVLGNDRFEWNDYHAASEVTRHGREVLATIMRIIQENNCIITCVDTDGAIFSAPKDLDPKELLTKVNSAMTPGIVVDYEKSWPRMISYKDKTYATLNEKGKLMKKGSAFKNRGLPVFLKSFIESFLYNALTDRIDKYEDEYFLLKRSISDKSLNVSELTRKVSIGFDYKEYISRVSGGKIAHFEAMRKEDKTDLYKAGDRVEFYYAGDRLEKTMSDMCKLYEVGNPNDYNIDYYINELNRWNNTFLNIIERKNE
jgi:DNA polymerase I